MSTTSVVHVNRGGPLVALAGNPNCGKTGAIKRETGGWAMPVVMAAYLFALAYLGAFITYRVALALGWG